MLLSNAFRPDPRVLKEARSLAEAGYEVTVVAWDREGRFPAQEETDSFTVQRVQDVRSSYGAGIRQALRLPKFWLHAWRRLNRLQPAVVHCHDFDTLPPGWLWAKLHRRPVIYDAHEYYTELQRPRLRGLLGKVLLALIGAAEQVLSRSAAAVVTVDERIASRYRNRRVVIIGHYPPVEFAQAPVGRGTGEASPSPSLSLGGRGTERDAGLCRALFYGSRHGGDCPGIAVAGGAGAAAAIAAAGRLDQPGRGGRRFTRLWPDWRSKWRWWAGCRSSRCRRSSVSADVALAVLQPIERYVAALPVKLFEYMACGLPVIISDFPPNRAVVASADCGLLVDPTNADAVAAAIAHLLTDPAEARRLGDNGRRAFETQYNWQALEPKLLALYAELSRQVDKETSRQGMELTRQDGKRRHGV